MKTIRNRIIIACCIFATFSSCKKDETPAIPVLPPASSFAMDFSDYNTEKSTNLLVENWLYSSVNVVFFSTIYTTSMIVPSIAYTASFATTPTYAGDQTWQWNYEFKAIGATYYATLNGTVENKGVVKWKMYIDKIGANGFTDFLWFEGTVKDSTSASWTIYETPASPNKVIQTEWTSSADHSKYELKYTLVSSLDDDKDSYIISGKDPDEQYDRYYEIYRSADNATISIKWSSDDKSGKVLSPNYFKDNSWHCWNQYLLDDWCD
ncbi:MAG TPA: hypothetical protein PKH79_07580 [Prolixibacteraceae bacterium]|nr:hypothetical protein [Prolixibacteraceae bacterium]HPS13300.1 hypothetical protein [Prolixibacteraceae bacterium]